MPWIAEFQTQNTKSRAFGETPEEAVSALLKTWRDGWAPRSGADPDYIAEYREEVCVSAFEAGEGYLIGPDDSQWHSETVDPMDPRFDAAFKGSGPSAGAPR